MEIARLAGVSIGTVDRVVHNRGRVSEETKKRVQRIIEETGYRPNIFASRLSRSKLYRFGVLMPHPSQDSRFWQLPLRGIEKAAEELRTHGIQVDYYFFDKYATAKSSFDGLCRQVLGELPDGLLVAPVIPGWTREFILRLPEHYPYVFFDSSLPNTFPISNIIQDSYQSGVLSAKLSELLAGGTGKIGIFQLSPTDFHLLERARGFRSYFAGKPGITCIENVVDGARKTESYQRVFSALLKAHPDLKGVFVTNAATFDASEFLRRRQQQKNIFIIGYDLIPENIRYMNEGWIDFLINPRPEMQGYQGIFALYRWSVLGETVEPSVMMPIDIITKENLAYYLRDEKNDENCR